MVDKRHGDTDDIRGSRDEGLDSIVVTKGCRTPVSEKRFSPPPRDPPTKRLSDGIRSSSIGINRMTNRNSNEPIIQDKQNNRRGKSTEPKNTKKSSTLRFEAIMDKRNGNNASSHASKRIVNSGRLVLDASYDELPECFHIGHNPESFYPPEIRRAIHNVQFIHSHMVQQDKFDEVSISSEFHWRVNVSCLLI